MMSMSLTRFVGNMGILYPNPSIEKSLVKKLYKRPVKPVWFTGRSGQHGHGHMCAANYTLYHQTAASKRRFAL